MADYPVILIKHPGAPVEVQRPKEKPKRRSILQAVTELIGGPQRPIRRFVSRVLGSRQTRDAGTTDYAFWDRARSGKAEGLEISGLLLKPLFSKVASWTMGIAPRFRLDNKSAMDQLNDWWQEHHSEIVQAYEDAVGLGDYYVVINSDLSVTLKAPNVVFPIVDPDDFGKIIGWRIEEQYPHPTEPGNYQTHIDEYTLTRRVHTIQNSNGVGVRTETYTNLLGRIPVIHVPNARHADELFGRSEGDALIPLLQMYGEIIEAGAEGNVRQGRPTPVVENMGSAEAVDKFWDTYGKTKTQELSDGSTETEEYIEFDADKLMTLAGTATFKWASPAAFISEVERILGLLYYLFLEHVELPEWVLGNAITGSRASAEAQVEPLVKFIEKKRSIAERWVIEVAMVVIGYMNLFDVSTQNAEQPKVKWEDLTTKDGQLTFTMVKFAYENHLVDRKTALMLMSALDIENPDEVLADADKEREELSQKEAQASEERALQDAEARLRQQDQRDTQAQDSEDVPSTEPQQQAQRAVA